MSDNTAPVPPGRGPFKAALAWLLRLDVAVPNPTEAELTAEMNRNYNWNFAVNLGDGVAFTFGISFLAASTVLPLFLSRLTHAPLAFGILAVLANAGWFLPQLFTANAMERLARKKPVVVNLGLFAERIPALLLPFAALVAVRSALGGVVWLLLTYAWFAIGSGVVAISWQDLVARCFPVDRRGSWLGLTAFIGALGGAGGSLLAAYLLRRYVFPISFFYTFLIGGVAILVSWAFLALTREPVQPACTQRRGTREYLASLPLLVRHDVNFRRFLIARVVMALGGMATGFITVSAVTRWQPPDSTAGFFTLALLGGQTVGNLSFGFLADRKGHKLPLELGCLAGVLAMLIAWLAPGLEWFFAVFALAGILSSAVSISGILIIMEFGEPARRSTYVGIANTTVGVASAIAPLLGAALASGGYPLLFVVAAAVNVLALMLFMIAVQEPRKSRLGSGDISTR